MAGDRDVVTYVSLGIRKSGARTGDWLHSHGSIHNQISGITCRQVFHDFCVFRYELTTIFSNYQHVFPPKSDSLLYKNYRPSRDKTTLSIRKQCLAAIEAISRLPGTVFHESIGSYRHVQKNPHPQKTI